jgi:LacI family transcriptional regulator
MHHVADRAGVSLKTVSRVINGEPGVAQATAERVAAAIAELGFRRNDLAASLRQGGSTATLGLVIEDLANPFYSAIARSVEAAAHARGFLVITGSCEEDLERERKLVLALLSRRVDALLLVPAMSERDHAWLLRELDGSPVVFLDRPPAGIEADAVLVDNSGGARMGAEHLLAQGHRRIAYVGDPDELFTAAERVAGFREAMEAAGVPVDDRLVRTESHDVAQAEAVVRELLALPDGERPTALLTGNNRNTVGALRAMRDGGAAPALVGFDDFELADLMAISVVRHDSSRMGAEAAALAFGRLAGDAGAARRVKVPTELVARGSGERRS